MLSKCMLCVCWACLQGGIYEKQSRWARKLSLHDRVWAPGQEQAPKAQTGPQPATAKLELASSTSTSRIPPLRWSSAPPRRVQADLDRLVSLTTPRCHPAPRLTCCARSFSLSPLSLCASSLFSHTCHRPATPSRDPSALFLRHALLPTAPLALLSALASRRCCCCCCCVLSCPVLVVAVAAARPTSLLSAADPLTFIARVHRASTRRLPLQTPVCPLFACLLARVVVVVRLHPRPPPLPRQQRLPRLLLPYRQKALRPSLHGACP